MTSWYLENIEPKIRSTVRLLRDNGFNTTCSCENEMLVEGDLTLDGEFKRLHDLLANNTYQNYHLNLELEVENGIHFSARFSLKVK